MRLAALAALLLTAACQAPASPTSAIDVVVPPILEQDRIPAAVIVTGDVDHIQYRRAFGTAELDTMFDLASCTKVVVTTTAAMKLVEEGKLSLDDPLGRYLPAFAGRRISVRECLHHCSGLPAYLTPKSHTPDGILHEIAGLKANGSGYTYSCLNMISVGRLVEQITKRPLAEYASTTIFEPLGMRDTSFAPPPARCAPTTPELRGVVHDPLARSYATSDHQSGNAGLFSTGDDLALFCQALLKGRILKPATVSEIFAPDANTRGLGWDVFDEPPWKPGVGHTGFTGTLIWINPATGRFAVVLTNRTYNGEQTNVNRLRKEVLEIVNR